MKGTKKSNDATALTKSVPSEDFAKNITENVETGSTLVLGISGGPDSVYLFSLCLKLPQDIRLIVAHVNHGLRGKQSDADENFVKNLCKKNKIKFVAQRLELQKKSEEAARDARYKFFEEVRKKEQAQWIVTAHHLNDNIETMLFNLIRGAHLNGIKGMSVRSPTRHLLRPLLGTTKKEILEYLKKHRIAFRLDKSNNNMDFSRNQLRKNIIPLFAKINPNFEQTFKETISNITQTTKYLEQQCKDWFHQNTTQDNIHLENFLHEPKGFQKLLLVHLYKRTHQSTKKLNNKHLEEVLNVLKLQQSGKKKEFGTDTFLEIIRDPKISTHYIRLTNKK